LEKQLFFEKKLEKTPREWRDFLLVGTLTLVKAQKAELTIDN
jgi:hypothetical protein